MMRANLNQLTASELSALLHGSSGHQPQLGSLGASAPGATAAEGFARNSVLSFLQQQQEEQQRAMLAQQLAALNTFPVPPSQPTDNLALLLQQQKQLQGLQGLGGTAGGNPLALLGGAASAGAGPAMASAVSFGAPAQPNQFDTLALAKILQAQQQAPNDLQRSSLLQDSASLPLPPDRRRKGRTGTFPQKLHQMLSDLEREEGGSDIASFLPHGRAFAIHKPRDFVKHVMPKYFRMSRFSSFQRQLNLYDFQRITEGPDKGSYYHELFVQGRPILSTMMKRNKIKGVKNVSSALRKEQLEDDHSIHEGGNEETEK